MYMFNKYYLYYMSKMLLPIWLYSCSDKLIVYLKELKYMFSCYTHTIRV